MLGTMSKAKAQRLTIFAYAGLALGLGGAVAISRVDRQSSSDLADQVISATPAIPSPRPSTPDAPVAQASPRTDIHAISGRLMAIRNKPEAIKPDPVPDEPKDEEPPAPPPTEEIVKYVGPVKLGPNMLAILSIGEKQRVVSKGKTITAMSGTDSHTIKVIGITEDDVTLEENSVERKVLKGEHSGAHLTLLSARPTKSASVKGAKPKSPGVTDAERRAGKVRDAMGREGVAEQLRMQMDRLRKGGDAVAAELTEKYIEAMRSQGLNNAAADRAIKMIEKLEK